MTQVSLDAERLLHLLSENQGCVNLPWATHTLQPHTPTPTEDRAAYMKAYMRIRRAAEHLAARDVLELSRSPDGLTWCTVTDPGVLLDRGDRKISRVVKRPDTIYKLPRCANEKRIAAARAALLSNRATDIHAQDIPWMFDEYREETQSKRIILRRSPEAGPEVEPYLVLPYRTRFTSREYTARNLENYDRIQDFSHTVYSDAVFLTLTTDPKKHKSLWHGWKYFGKAWTLFKQQLQRKTGRNPEYIIIYEFTKSGLMHAHALLFGMRWLLPTREISRMWDACGQGRIVHLYSLKSQDGRWTWSRAKPKDAARNDDGSSYLKKYLKKAFWNPSTQALYWASNKRYFTCSRTLSALFPKKPHIISVFDFFGSCHIDDLPQVILDEIVHCFVPPIPPPGPAQTPPATAPVDPPRRYRGPDLSLHTA